MKSKVKYKLNSPLTRYRWEKWGLEYNTRHFWKKYDKIDANEFKWEKHNAILNYTERQYRTHNVEYPTQSYLYTNELFKSAQIAENSTTYAGGYNYCPDGEQPPQSGSPFAPVPTFDWRSWDAKKMLLVSATDLYVEDGKYKGAVSYAGWETAIGADAKSQPNERFRYLTYTPFTEYTDVDIDKKYVVSLHPFEVNRFPLKGYCGTDHGEEDADTLLPFVPISGWLSLKFTSPAIAEGEDSPYPRGYAQHRFLGHTTGSEVIVGPKLTRDLEYKGMYWGPAHIEEDSIDSQFYSDEIHWPSSRVIHMSYKMWDPNNYDDKAYDPDTEEYFPNNTGSLDQGLTYAEDGQELCWGSKEDPANANRCNFKRLCDLGRCIVMVYTPHEAVLGSYRNSLEEDQRRPRFHNKRTDFTGVVGSPTPSDYWENFKFYLVDPNSSIDGQTLRHVLPLVCKFTPNSVYLNPIKNREYSSQRLDEIYPINLGNFDPLDTYAGLYRTGQAPSGTTSLSTPTAEHAVSAEYEDVIIRDTVLPTGFIDNDTKFRWLVNGPIQDWSKGAFIGYVSSLERHAYPDDGFADSYWYVLLQAQHIVLPGEYIRTIWSEDRDAYPDDGSPEFDDPYYYIYDRGGLDHNPTFRMEDVVAFDPNAYPQEGFRLGYYYFLAEEITNDEFEITDQLLRNGITYKHTINSQQELQYGSVASASLEFTIVKQGKPLLDYINKAECECFIMMENDNEWRSLGIFKTNKITQNADHSLKVTCYDKLYEPIQLTVVESSFPEECSGFSAIFRAAVEAMGLEADESTIPAAPITWIPTITNTDFNSFRDLLAAWAEIMLCAIVVNKAGKVVCRRYQDYGQHYVRWTNEDYATYLRSIDKIQEIKSVRLIDEDGSSEFAALEPTIKSSNSDYIIKANKFAVGRPIGMADVLLDNLKQYHYSPGTITAFKDKFVMIGDICLIDQQDFFYVMSITIAPSGVTLACTGNRTYE